MFDLFATHPESQVHPHVPEERADLFAALDGGSTEVETLELLHALVRCYKPTSALETGTAQGFGTLAIALAMSKNGFGVVHTVESNPTLVNQARTRLPEKLATHVVFVCDDSRRFIAQHTGPVFDLCFFDSDMAVRTEEFWDLRHRNLLTKGAVCLFHDTSRLRTPDLNPSYLSALDEICRGHEHIVFPYSRGFTLIQLVS